jgi:hypothetical protein
LGGLLSGAYQHRRDWRARLQVDFPGDPANIVIVDRKKEDGAHVAIIYIRARVKNIGRRTAKGARVFLTSLKEEHRGGQITETSFNDSVALAWAGWNFSPRDLPPAAGVSFYADLVRFSKYEPGWNFSVTRLFGNESQIRNYSGTYRCQLTLTADNAEPAIYEIDVTYEKEKDWPNMRAVAVGPVKVKRPPLWQFWKHF